MIYVHARLHTPSSSAAPVRPITPKATEIFRQASTLLFYVLHKYYHNGRYVLLQDLLDTSFQDRTAGGTIVAPAPQLRALAMLPLLNAGNLYLYQISLNVINFYNLKKKNFFSCSFPGQFISCRWR